MDFEEYLAQEELRGKEFAEQIKNSGINLDSIKCQNPEKIRIGPGSKQVLFPVVVNYSLPIRLRLQQINCKNCREDQEWIIKHFPIEGWGRASKVMRLEHIDHPAGTDQILKILDDKYLRPAILTELLSFAATYFHPHLYFPIVALGSTKADCAVHIDKLGITYCTLGFSRIDMTLSPVYRFASIYKEGHIPNDYLSYPLPEGFEIE